MLEHRAEPWEPIETKRVAASSVRHEPFSAPLHLDKSTRGWLWAGASGDRGSKQTVKIKAHASFVRTRLLAKGRSSVESVRPL
jgi:hypothetical protein